MYASLEEKNKGKKKQKGGDNASFAPTRPGITSLFVARLAQSIAPGIINASAYEFRDTQDRYKHVFWKINKRNRKKEETAVPFFFFRFLPLSDGSCCCSWTSVPIYTWIEPGYFVLWRVDCLLTKYTLTIYTHIHLSLCSLVLCFFI